MEERIVEDEYGRGIRFKKTKDGRLDVVDELCADEAAPEGENESGEEVVIEFPEEAFDGEGEEYAELSSEEAAALKKKKEEEQARRLATYQALCAQGDGLLADGEYEQAEQVFAKALDYDDEATAASVGYWRAKTQNFTDPDVLVDEYVEAGMQTLEYDLGYEATAILKREYHDVFQAKLDELRAEEEPLQEQVESKQAYRRSILHTRMKKSGIAMGVSAVPTLASLILAIVFGLQNFSTPDDTYILPTILLGAAFVVFFIVFGIFFNKFLNDCRMNGKNEDLSETDDGARLLEIRDYKELYYALAQTAEDDNESAEN